LPGYELQIVHNLPVSRGIAWPRTSKMINAIRPLDGGQKWLVKELCRGQAQVQFREMDAQPRFVPQTMEY
jgi:hypothetical protein